MRTTVLLCLVTDWLSPVPQRRRRLVVDGKCLRGAKRPDGSQIYFLSAVRHDDALTVAAREIGAKTNEIPSSSPCWSRSTTRN